MLERIFQDKDNWKKETFELIKSDLLSVKDNRFIQYNQSSATHLVCIYGKSQVGKTTLILNMIGLKEEWKRNVSEILRGGVKRGNSSTSTAIIYSQNSSEEKSNINKYGIRIETLDSPENSTFFDYYTPEEMVARLQTIRNQVENNEFSNKSILHISIPREYFSTSFANDRISILDLPGVESRNKKEKAHVESLITRYIPLSSVCIIACPANNIQSLEYEEISRELNWKQCSHKFLVVLTKSYSDGLIKMYFQTKRDERSVKFEQFVKDRFNEELSNILGKNNNIEVYPLDIGDSLERLLTEEINNEEDRIEIRKTRDNIILSLIKSIVSRKGNILLSTIKELHVIVEHSDENKIAELTKSCKNLEFKISDNLDKLSKLKIKLENTNNELLDLQNDIQPFEILIKNVESLIVSSTTKSKIIVSDIKKDIIDLNLFKKGYFYDKDKYCMVTLSKKIYLLVDNIVKKALSMIEESGLYIDIYSSKVSNSIFSNFIKKYEDKLYPSVSLLNMLIGNDCKTTLSEAYDLIPSIEIIINEKIQTLIISPCKELIKNKIRDIVNDVTQLRNRKIKIERKIKDINAENENIKSEIDESNREIEIAKDQKKRDIATLNKYLNYAEIAFSCQKEDIRKKINSNISKDERLLYLLLLGVIEKEYKTLITSSYG